MVDRFSIHSILSYIRIALGSKSFIIYIFFKCNRKFLNVMNANVNKCKFMSFFKCFQMFQMIG